MKTSPQIIDADTITMPETALATRPTLDADLLISKAIDSRAPVESLERLLAMRKEIIADQAREEYFAALARVQSEAPIIPKRKEVRDRDGKHMYNFAPMDDIKPVVDPFIRKHGFSYRWDVREKEVVCIITHHAGHSEESKFPLQSAKAPAMNEVQALASGQSYAKRYTFINGFGFVVGGEDDDARSAEIVLITPEQAITIEDCLESCGAKRDLFLQWVSKAANRDVADVRDIPATMHGKVMAALKEKMGGSK